MQIDLWKLKHPQYLKYLEDWTRCRIVYEGGRRFINQYLKRFSSRETQPDFERRLSLTYNPGFASTIVDEIKNSIYLRMHEITRIGGPATYQNSITGANGGVDLKGSGINNFMGQNVLPELLNMSRVGVFVDMPAIGAQTMADLNGKKPYLYIYQAEQILNWNTIIVQEECIYTTLLLHETIDTYDQGLIVGTEDRLRRMDLTEEGVVVTVYNKDSEQINEKVLLKGMTHIPFVIFEINKSVMRDIADYQIALLNIESTDLKYILEANFTTYIEAFDPRTKNLALAQGNSDDPSLAHTETINMGPMNGRAYPEGTTPPSFIHPSSEPLKASMAKQAQMKNDMRKLAGLALASIEPMFASAESKQMDDRSLESGLSYIGLELERGERLIGQAWAYYMSDTKIPTVKYPRKYSLKTDKDRREDAAGWALLIDKVPSRTYSKEIGKLLSRALLEQKVDDEVLEKINTEIDAAKFINSDAASIQIDVQAGLVDAVTASDARGYDGKVVVPIAKKEHTERLAEIAKAQSAPSGVDPSNPGAKDQKTASQNPDNQGDKSKPVRGNANG